MATKVYNSAFITLMNGDEVYLHPLKIKILREVMEAFDELTSSGGEDLISKISKCALISMKQYYPAIKTIDDLEDQLDMKSMYKVLEIGADIKLDSKDDSDNKDDKKDTNSDTDSGQTWDTFDLAKLESELFLLGIWKDYEDLEESLSMPELKATLEAKRESDYNEKRFFASIQGIDLDAQNGNKENAWDRLKAKHFSGGATTNPNDVVSLQGYGAQKAGFGIGMGLDYERID